MSDTGKDESDESAEGFMDLLKEQGFFKQIEQLEASLKVIGEDLETIGEAAVDRMGETESAVAHVLAMEAVLVELLKVYPVELEAVKQSIRNKTAGISGNPDGSPMVVSVAEDIFKQVNG